MEADELVHQSAEFLSEVKSEMKKCCFPTREEVMGTTVVVLVTSFVFAIYLWVADMLIMQGLRGHPRGVRFDERAQRPRPRRKWYIVHTYSGFEERVKQTLRQRADALGMGDDFGEIRIPTETIVEFKGGKKREIQRKFFPGYILVEMRCPTRPGTW